MCAQHICNFVVTHRLADGDLLTLRFGDREAERLRLRLLRGESQKKEKNNFPSRLQIIRAQRLFHTTGLASAHRVALRDLRALL